MPSTERHEGARTFPLIECDRCGALVGDWAKHSDYHAMLAVEAAVRNAVLIDSVRERDRTDEMRQVVAWAIREAKALASTAKL